MGPLYVYLLRMLSIFINFVFAMLDNVAFISSIVGGLIAGVALLVILYAAVKWRRKTLCSGKL